jgi:tripartite-type tricarboxylate transporter receptor subunit TctC
MLRPLIALMAVAMALAAVAVPAGGEEFYRGKTIRLIVPSDVGGGYDL